MLFGLATPASWLRAHMPSSRQSRRARIEPAELVDRQPESRRSTSAARRNCTSCARHRQCYIALLLGSVLANVVQLVAFYLSRPVERQASTRHSVRSSYYHALVGAVSTFHSDGENLSHGAALEWQAQQPLLPPEQQFQELHRQEQQLQEQQPQQKPQQPQQPQQQRQQRQRRQQRRRQRRWHRAWVRAWMRVWGAASMASTQR